MANRTGRHIKFHITPGAQKFFGLPIDSIKQRVMEELEKRNKHKGRSLTGIRQIELKPMVVKLVTGEKTKTVYSPYGFINNCFQRLEIDPNF